MIKANNAAGIPPGGRGGIMGLVNRFLGRREIYKRVQEGFPSWDEYAKEKMSDPETKGKMLVELPSHRVFISSPLQWNFLFFILVGVALLMAYARPDWVTYFIYGAILFVFLIAFLFILQDGIFFHLEGLRLEWDCSMINKNKFGPALDKEPEKLGFWQTLMGRKKSVFRSTLLQIHYQNILRTFQQGNRRARVEQESSITDIHTLLSQRGMKLVWTFIEVLPQLGLLGTLIGLSRMFFAFNANETLPELAIISGFGTALGTTILANLFVLILRPLYMRNERSMNEILSALQMLMATFILPTQNYVLGVFGAVPGLNERPPPVIGAEAPSSSGPLARSVGELAQSIQGMVQTQRKQARDGGDTAQLAEDMKTIAETIKQAGPIQMNLSDQALASLTETMRGLTVKLESLGGSTSADQISHELTQLRMLNHDTLVLLDQLAVHLKQLGHDPNNLLTQKEKIRRQVFAQSLSHSKEETPRRSGPDKGATDRPDESGKVSSGA